MNSTPSIAQRIAQGLAKIAIAMRHDAWRGAGRRHITPTQAQILDLVHRRNSPPLVGDVADALAITPATASRAIAALVRKGLLVRGRAQLDRRAVSLALTRRGHVVARELIGWPEVLADACGELPEAEQTALLRMVLRMIRSLQDRGLIPIQRMCVECRFFAPYVYEDTNKPHHCHFVNAPFGDGELRLDCSDMQPMAAESRARVWQLLVNGKPAAGKCGDSSEGALP